MSEPTVMMPKPPSWISTRMTASPKPVQYTGVSTTINPVTQVADVAVKNAVSSPAPPGPLAETGSSSSAVPMPIAAANPTTTNWAGWRSRKRRGDSSVTPTTRVSTPSPDPLRSRRPGVGGGR
jgi:hypothetical protein